MATSKLLAEILAEMKQLRTDINRQSNIGNRSRPQQRSTSNSTAKQPPPARKLLQDIANRPIPKPICWYHQRHGIATKPTNCPGPTMCSWNQDEEVAKLKTIIATMNQNSTPAQKRLTTIRPFQQPDTVAATATIVKPLPTAVLSTSPVVPPIPPCSTTSDMDWNTAVTMDDVDDLASDLADLSDSD